MSKDVVSQLVNAILLSDVPICAQEFGSRFAHTEDERIALCNDVNFMLDANDAMRMQSIVCARDRLSVL